MNPEIINLFEEVLVEFESALHSEIDDWSQGDKDDDERIKKLHTARIQAYRDRFTNLVMESK